MAIQKIKLNDGTIVDIGSTGEVLEVEGDTLVAKENASSNGVVANPSSEGTEDLTKLQVGNTVYNIPQGVGSGGGIQLYLHEIKFNGMLEFVIITLDNNNFIENYQNIDISKIIKSYWVAGESSNRRYYDAINFGKGLDPSLMTSAFTFIYLDGITPTVKIVSINNRIDTVTPL